MKLPLHLTMSPQGFLIRAVITLSTILLLAHTAEVLSLRRSTKPLTTIVREEELDMPFKISTQLITQDIHRLKSSRYLGIHLYPVIPWLLLAYHQTSSTLRKRNPLWHRRLGKAYLVLSATMTMGHMMMFITGETILGEEEFYIDPLKPGKFFTFRSACLVFTLWWVVCMYNLYMTATRRLLAQHKYWTYQFLATGFGVGVARIYILLSYALLYPPSADQYMAKSAQDLIMGYSLWAGFTLNCLLAHCWTRPRPSFRIQPLPKRSKEL